MKKRVRIASLASWTMFLVMLIWLPWAAYSYSQPSGLTTVINQPIGAHAPQAPSIVLRFAATLRRIIPVWVWRLGILWYELLAIAELSLWINTNRANLGVMPRIGFWLAIINPFFPLLLIVLTLGT